MTDVNPLFSQSADGPEDPLLMGILNVTPDSFYDGGEYDSSTRALERSRIMVKNGADIIDVGGESTRPGADPVPVGEEKDRVVPVVESIVNELSVPVSVDTSKPSVAEETLDRGASMINDVTGFEDPELRQVVADHGCPVCIMHMQGTPRTMQEDPDYGSVVQEVVDYLESRAQDALDAGIDSNNIIVDPGIGFGKTLEHNRRLLSSMSSIADLGYRVMVGHSRKSFIGDVLDREVDDRLAGTLAVSADLIEQGVDVLRIHDVREHSDLRELSGWLAGNGENADGRGY